MNDLTKPVEVLPPINLPALAKQINDNHRDILSNAKTMVTKAIAAGDALIAAKAAVADGTWLRWLRDNTTVSERTAQLWMQLAEHKRQLEIEARERGATIADQTMNEAIRPLRARKTSKKPPKLDPPKAVTLGAMEAPAKREEPSLADYITNTAADELFPVLREHYDNEQLTKLAGLINKHLPRAPLKQTLQT